MNMAMRGTLAKLRSECDGLKSEIFGIKKDLTVCSSLIWLLNNNEKQLKAGSTDIQSDEAHSDERTSHDRNMKYLQTTFEMIENNIRRLDNDVQGKCASKESMVVVRLQNFSYRNTGLSWAEQRQTRKSKCSSWSNYTFIICHRR